MLNQLQIRHIAIVDKLDLEFFPGLNVVTGETGAGKSIVVDALGLALGERADAGVIQHGAERAEVNAVFDVADNPAAKAWLDEQDLTDEGPECIVRRTFSRNGRSRAYINGMPVPVQQLRSLADSLVDIHGQHEHQSLLKSDIQRQILDRFGGNDDTAEQVRGDFSRWQQALAQWQAMQQSAEERQLQIQLLQHQVDELAKLDLQPGEFQQLENEHAKLAHGTRLLETTQQVINLLDNDESLSVLAALHQCVNDLEGLVDIDPSLGQASELLNTASINAQESTTLLRHYAADLDIDPQHLTDIEDRIAAVHQLTRKHRCEPEDLPGLRQRLEKELDLLQSSDEKKASLQEEIASLEQRYRKSAGQLSKKRLSAAKDLAERITQSMQELGMPGGRFSVELDKLPQGQENLHGLEKITFIVSANPGHPLKPLAKVASGGELSRISLAIQVAISHLASIPTIIYDEVDVGIGGATAEVVGRQLRQISGNRQVISVTHLPQVAAQGHHHYRVKKHIEGNQTFTHMLHLTQREREDEIARMLGGVKLTAQTRAHAKEMLKIANRDDSRNEFQRNKHVKQTTTDTP